jgi:hypothetical protein
MSTASDNKLSFDKLAELNKQFDRQLKELQGKGGSKNKPEGRPLSYKKFFLKMLILGLCLVAPFIVLVRMSVYMYLNYQLNGWLALAVGVLMTIVLLIGYGLFLTFQYGKEVRINKYITRGIVVLVMAYTLYGLLYYSSMNTKTDEIKSYYRSLHPIMRVALATTTLADSDLLVTDIQRKPEDYAQMGLPVNHQSLHYVQPNGYVHAVDLRTRGRAEWKNWLTRITINIIGLKTIRHVGTTDHLHVYLPLND